MSTPARRQYIEIKATYPDTLLAYQVGDFFEFFDDDARTVARELQIVLTARSYGPDEMVPLAGVPLHALETYLGRLVARGYRVAVCEQVSPPGRGLVQRKVTHVVTPGTVIEPGMVSAKHDRYLVALSIPSGETRNEPAGLAYVEVTTGLFACTQLTTQQSWSSLRTELDRLQAVETLAPESALSRLDQPSENNESPFVPDGTSACPDAYFDAENARSRLCRHFGTTTLAAFGCEGKPAAASAAGAILAYIERMNPALLPLLTSLTYYDLSGHVEIDGRTWRALEVVEPKRALADTHGPRSGGATLLDTLDATRTPMGARLLRRTLLEPSRDRETLEERLDAVTDLVEHQALRQRLGSALDSLGDLERLIGRAVHGAATIRELHALAATLARIPSIVAALRSCEAAALIEARGALDPCDDVSSLIASAVADPASGTGRLLREGFSAELDELAETAAEARKWIATLETTERERTGIKSLRVGFNSIFGYYIDISKPNLSRVPPDYQRRQTLTNGERYVTAELKEHEARVLNAQERIEALERELFAGVLRDIAAHQGRVRTTASALARADVWLSLAEVAVARHYVRPELTDEPLLDIEEGRHPIVEASLEHGEFIPNATRLLGGAREDDNDADSATPAIMLLTGPNMAGKSTYLRQVASIVLLAHIGSYVPARRARIGMTDRIFARVGAEDDLAHGLSTFMLEMVETAYILRHATSSSLVILDEVGRGTSVRDGLAIARAIAEYLHDGSAPRTMFATHFSELAQLAGELPRLVVYRMAITEHAGNVVFLHRVTEGVSENSYGVHVARMAGLPTDVTTRAEALLQQRAPDHGAYVAEPPARYVTRTSEAHSSDGASHGENYAHIGTENHIEGLALALASLNIAAMTPIEAINALFSLQQRATELLRLMPASEGA